MIILPNTFTLANYGRTHEENYDENYSAASVLDVVAAADQRHLCPLELAPCTQQTGPGAQRATCSAIKAQLIPGQGTFGGSMLGRSGAIPETLQ